MDPAVAKTAAAEKEEKETADLADSCEAAISKLTVAPVILTHSDDSGSSDDDDDENTEKSRWRKKYNFKVENQQHIIIAPAYVKLRKIESIPKWPI